MFLSSFTKNETSFTNILFNLIVFSLLFVVDIGPLYLSSCLIRSLAKTKEKFIVLKSEKIVFCRKSLGELRIISLIKSVWNKEYADK